MADEVVIGIDLGTTNSCAAYYYRSRLKVLESCEGDRTVPSFVFFTEQNGVIVGKHAKVMGQAKPEYGVYETKRLIGRKYDEIASSLQYFTFKVADVSNNPVIMIEQKTEKIKQTPSDVAAKILTKIKRDVEAKLGNTINKVVITVPAYFDVSQREATLEAANAAGFTVLKLLNEPTAAALSYYFENESEEENYSLVYDLGGGTFDVAILKRNANNIDIIAVDGNSSLGGKDFDNLIIDYVCNELQSKYDYNPKSNKKDMRRVQNLCQEAKHLLSSAAETEIPLIALVKDHPSVVITLTREKFEDMADGILKQTIEIVDTCLKNSKIAKNEIKDIILSGGSTRMPKIQKMLSDYFDGRTVNKFVNPDECVAEGAALQAAMLSSNSRQNIEEVKITDVVPLSLGVKNFDGKMVFLISKNTPLPATGVCTYSNVFDEQQVMLFEVFEGERLNAMKNRCLGTFTLTDLTPAPPGQCEVDLTMTVDKNGILKVTAKEKFGDNVKDLKIVYSRDLRSKREVQNAIHNAAECKEEDERFKVFTLFKSYLTDYCIGIMYNLDKKCLTDLFSEIYELCEETQNEINAMDETTDLEVIKKLIKKVKLRCEIVVKNCNFEFLPVPPKEVKNLETYDYVGSEAENSLNLDRCSLK